MVKVFDLHDYYAQNNQLYLSIEQTNDLYFEAFQQWAQEFPNVKIINDGTRRNEVSILDGSNL